MPDAFGNPFPGELVRQGIDPFLQGAPGESPLTLAAVDAFRRNTLPIIQQQMQLAGLGQSGALGVAIGDAMAGSLPQFITADLQNRFQAANVLQGEDQLTQSAAQLAANIANQERALQLQSLQTGGNLLLGLTDPLAKAGQLQQEQQRLALQAVGAGGELQRGIVQESFDASQAERLRQQALAENATTGLFGSSVLPPVAQQRSTTKSSSSK